LKANKGLHIYHEGKIRETYLRWFDLTTPIFKRLEQSVCVSYLFNCTDYLVKRETIIGPNDLLGKHTSETKATKATHPFRALMKTYQPNLESLASRSRLTLGVLNPKQKCFNCVVRKNGRDLIA
jgi:hypothetical protein